MPAFVIVDQLSDREDACIGTRPRSVYIRPNAIESVLLNNIPLNRTRKRRTH